MTTLEELHHLLTEVQKELQAVREENTLLKQKLGIRQILTPVRPSTTAMDDVQNGENGTSAVPVPVKTEKKPPPFFITGVKSVQVFNNFLSHMKIVPSEMKALANSDLKILLNTSDDYRKLRKALDDVTSLPDSDKKELGSIQFHTFRLPEDKPFTVFIRGLHHSTDLKALSDELTALGHHVINIINVHIKKKVDNKSIITKLPLFKVEVKTCENNRHLFDIKNLGYCQISVEMPKKSPSLPQCTRCQDYGHTKNYCTKSPKCVECSERHSIKDCKSPKTTPPKCANCKDEHTANYKGCSYYQSKISAMKPAPKVTAVDRIKDTPPSSLNKSSHQSSYSSVAAVKPLPKLAPTPVSVPKPADNTNQLLEILQRMESSQKTLLEKFTGLEQRVLDLENSGNSLPRKARKKQ